MAFKKLNLWWLSAAASLGLGIFFLNCVGGADVESYRVAFVQPGIAGNKGLDAFALNSINIGEFGSRQGRDVNRNCQEWQKALGGNVKLSDIELLLYKVPINTFYAWMQENALDSVMSGNTFLEALHKQPEMWEYFLFAKENEVLNGMNQVPDADILLDAKGGNSFDQTKEKLSLASAAKSAEKLKNPNLSDFLKQRYAFQLIRTQWLSQKTAASESLYDQYLGSAEQPKSIVAAWAGIHKAYALRSKGDMARANYVLSKIFDYSDYVKVRAAKAFSREEAPFNASLAMAQNNHEKAVLYAMRAFMNPGPVLEDLKTIQSLDPTNDCLATLIVRETNKLENWLFTPELTGFDAALRTYDDYDYEILAKDPQYYTRLNRTKDLAYLTEVKNFLKGVNSSEQAVPVCLAELSLLEGNNADASVFLNKISDKSSSKAIILQKKVLQALYMARTEDLTTSAAKEKVYSTLQEVASYTKKEKENRSFQALLLAFKRAYEKKNDFVTAGLLANLTTMSVNSPYGYYNTNFDDAGNYGTWYENYDEDYDWRSDYAQIAYFDEHAGAADLEKLIQLLDNKGGSNNLDKYLCANSRVTRNYLLDLLGTIYFRDKNLKQASETFAKISPSYWNKQSLNDEFSSSPFRIYRLEDAATEKKLNDTHVISKADFVQKLIQYETAANQGDDKSKAEASFRTACAYYNTSYHGNSWIMTNFGRSNGESLKDNYFFAPNLKQQYREAYYKCTLASDWFKKTLELARKTNDNELTAKCLIMLTQCENKSAEVSGDDKHAFRSSSFASELKAYSKTNTYTGYSCPSLKNFVKGI